MLLFCIQAVMRTRGARWINWSGFEWILIGILDFSENTHAQVYCHGLERVNT